MYLGAGAKMATKGTCKESVSDTVLPYLIQLLSIESINTLKVIRNHVKFF